MLAKITQLFKHPFWDILINFIKKFKSSKSYWSVSSFILIFTLREAIAWKFGSAIRTFCEEQALNSNYATLWDILGFVFDVGGSVELVILGTFIFLVLSFVKVSESENSSVSVRENYLSIFLIVFVISISFYQNNQMLKKLIDDKIVNKYLIKELTKKDKNYNKLIRVIQKILNDDETRSQKAKEILKDEGVDEAILYLEVSLRRLTGNRVVRTGYIQIAENTAIIDNFEKMLRKREEELKNKPLNNDIMKIIRQDIQVKFKNINKSHRQTTVIIDSIKKFILEEAIKIDISKEDKELIKMGDIGTIQNSLKRIVDNTSGIKKSAKASFQQGLLHETLMEYEPALFNYKKAVSSSSYSNKEYRQKGIEFSKKLNRKKDEKYFKDKLYYGLLKMKKNSIYTGAIKNGKASYCGIEKYKDGSYYIGQYDEGHRVGYGFAYIQGNKKPYLRRYNNDGSKLSNAETIEVKKDKGKVLIGKMKNGHLHGRGLVMFSDKSTLLANFEKGKVRNSIGCYFEPTEKRVTWRRHNGGGKIVGSYIIEANK